MSESENTNKLLAKRRRGETLTEAEIEQLEGYDAEQRFKNRPFNKGAYVKFFLDKGVIEGTVVGSDKDGNYLIEYGTDSQCVIKPHTVSRKYLLRESTLLELDQYVIGVGLYERVVNKEGKIEKFFDKRLESMRVSKEKIVLPDSERLRPGDNWGMETI